MAGGGGTRLFPLSQTKDGLLPKQFLSVIPGPTLLQRAIGRIPKECSVTVIPESRYTEEVLRQARECGRPVTCIDEPFGCNTAVAVLYTAALQLFEPGGRKGVLCFIPADHEMDDSVFAPLLLRACEAAGREDCIVTLGIRPDSPQTQYGYIQSEGLEGSLLPVKRFVEKPDLATAMAYLEEGSYWWNAGMFASRAEVFVQKAMEHCPQIMEILLEAADPSTSMSQEEAYTLLRQKGLNKSIDYALMEHVASDMLLVPTPAELRWNDLGNFESLGRYMSADGEENLRFETTEVTSKECRGTMVCNYTSLPVFLEQMEDVLVVVTEHGVLVRKKQ